MIAKELQYRLFEKGGYVDTNNPHLSIIIDEVFRHFDNITKENEKFLSAWERLDKENTQLKADLESALINLDKEKVENEKLEAELKKAKEALTWSAKRIKELELKIDLCEICGYEGTFMVSTHSDSKLCPCCKTVLTTKP